ncbi:MAG: hypothetical protein OZSIB_3101 [Candidatus Ozemobacter sibiricus]|uniref:Uncharacterized protein n=1 Tax=Candidatus Ozemobacter sibiricus TaxID=2268124 RepID=A0A367ZQD6_9BACT|nr:MAG: hypothetical protein OZSIB_3101 [Candidatus Ozemobacter sibiricus]
MDKPQTDAILAKLAPLLGTLIDTFQRGDYAQRREAAIALSKFKGERATDFLLRTYETDNIQDFMALALGNLESSKAVSLLVSALNDSQQEVRFNAAQALGMIKNDEALNVLMEALNEYADANVTGGSQRSGGRLFFEEEAIISAITALGRLKSHFAIPLLKRLLAQEKSPRIRSTIIMALGAMANERLLPIFQSALRDEDARVRANAIEAIEAIKSSSIVGIIQPYLEDPNNRVRANVAKAIFKYGDFDVSETLTQMLSHPDKWFRGSAAYAMGEIRDVRFIPKLAQALKDEDPDVRRNATNALRKIESPNAVGHLIPLLDDPNFDVRVQAVIALARCSPQRAVDLLAQKLPSETNSIVRATIVSALGDCAGPGHRDLLVRSLDDPDPRVVANAIEAIQKLSRQKPEAALVHRFKELLSHEDNRVKTNVIKTLWLWNEFSVLDNLQTLLTRNDAKHRQSGIFVLGEIGRAISQNPSLAAAVNDLIAHLVEGTGPTGQPGPAAPRPTAQESVARPEAPAAAPAAPAEQAPPVAPSEAARPAPSFERELELAASAVQAKEFASAEKIYQKILAADPDHLQATIGLANLYFQVKKFPEAARFYEKILALHPNSAKAHYNLGTIAYLQKEYEKAREHLLRALHIYPKLLGGYLILAQIYQQGGHTAESIQLLSKAIELSPRNPVLYQKLAMLHLQAREYPQAIEVLTRAVALSPLDVESNLMLAFCYSLTGDPAAAFAAMDATLRACAQSPQPDESLKALMQSYLFVKSTLDQS